MYILHVICIGASLYHVRCQKVSATIKGHLVWVKAKKHFVTFLPQRLSPFAPRSKVYLDLVLSAVPPFVRMCVCVCARVRIYIYIYVFAWVCKINQQVPGSCFCPLVPFNTPKEHREN